MRVLKLRQDVKVAVFARQWTWRAARTVPLGVNVPGSRRCVLYAQTKGKTTTVESQFRRKDGGTRWGRVTFVRYVDAKGRLVYPVTVHRDISEPGTQSQQLYAMKTTMGTIASAVDAKAQVDPVMQCAFASALEDTRSKLTAINRISSFKDRRTPFGFSLLDVDENS